VRPEPQYPAELTIRDASPAEERLIADLTLRAYEEYAAIMEPAAWAGLRDAIVEALATASRADRIVAESNGRLVGSVLLFPPRVASYGDRLVGGLHWPEVRLLAVDPEARGLGIGKALMRECIRRAAAAGATHLGIHTSRSMRVAIEMYRKMGFVRDPEHDFQPPGAELVQAYALEIVG
jgi:GNAT superfamily N-acetyltransferase